MNLVAFISGVNGQDGSYLAELLLQKGYEVHGLIRRSSTDNLERIRHILNKIHLHYGDIVDASCLSKIISEIKPNECYNLAAQSEIGVSFASPSYTSEVNALGPLRLLECIRLYAPQCKFCQASSSEIYGNASCSPQNEDTRCSPISPYAISKLHAFWTTIYFRESYNIHASNAIFFNHESPRRPESFVTRKIVKSAVRIARNEQSCLYLGNLHAKRDWGFAGDYVDAMWRMTQMDKADDYVISTGQSHSVKEFCEEAFNAVGIDIQWHGEGLNEVGVNAKTNDIIISVDQKYYRLTEVVDLVGDFSKAKDILKWSPVVGFNDLVRMMVKHDMG